jgi:hypothetical protein
VLRWARMAQRTVEVASTVILSRLALTSRGRGDRAARSWTGAATALAGTFVPLAAYFTRANMRLLDPALPAAAVETELSRWQRWNMARTALAVAVLAAAVNAARQTSPQCTASPLSLKPPSETRARSPARLTPAHSTMSDPRGAAEPHGRGDAPDRVDVSQQPVNKTSIQGRCRPMPPNNECAGQPRVSETANGCRARSERSASTCRAM